MSEQCATNHPELLDRAAAGRFEVRLELKPPEHQEFLRFKKILERRHQVDAGPIDLVEGEYLVPGQCQAPPYWELVHSPEEFKEYIVKVTRAFLEGLPEK